LAGLLALIIAMPLPVAIVVSATLTRPIGALTLNKMSPGLAILVGLEQNIRAEG
jgi:hypothetical protein